MDRVQTSLACCVLCAVQAQQRAADSSVAQQTLMQQLVQQSNLLKQRIELICSHALKRQQQKQELQQQQQQLDAEEGAEAEALQQQQVEQQQQQEQEQMRLTMSGAKNLADQLLALLDKQQLSASGATTAAAAAHVTHGAAPVDALQQQQQAAAVAAAATWQQQLKQQLLKSSSGLLDQQDAAAEASSMDGSHQKLNALLDAQAVIQGLLPQRNTSSGGGSSSFVIGTIPSREEQQVEPATDGDAQLPSSSSPFVHGAPAGTGGQTPSRLGGLGAVPAGTARQLDLDLHLSSPEDFAVRLPASHGSRQGAAAGQQQEQELPFHQAHGMPAPGSALSSLESDLARRAGAGPGAGVPAAASGSSRQAGLTGSQLSSRASPAGQLRSPSPAAAAGSEPDAAAAAAGGVTWYYSALGGEGAWGDASPGAHGEEEEEEEQGDGRHGSASAAAAAVQAAKAASAAAVRASVHLLGLGLASSPESPEEEEVAATGFRAATGFQGQHLQVCVYACVVGMQTCPLQSNAAKCVYACVWCWLEPAGCLSCTNMQLRHCLGARWRAGAV